MSVMGGMTVVIARMKHVINMHSNVKERSRGNTLQVLVTMQATLIPAHTIQTVGVMEVSLTMLIYTMDPITQKLFVLALVRVNIVTAVEIALNNLNGAHVLRHKHVVNNSKS